MRKLWKKICELDEETFAKYVWITVGVLLGAMWVSYLLGKIL